MFDIDHEAKLMGKKTLFSRRSNEKKTKKKKKRERETDLVKEM